MKLCLHAINNVNARARPQLSLSHINVLIHWRSIWYKNCSQLASPLRQKRKKKKILTSEVILEARAARINSHILPYD